MFPEFVQSVFGVLTVNKQNNNCFYCMVTDDLRKLFLW